jgi:membrane complex biogenesis BtpA family protein
VKIFAARRPLIGMIHLPPLPGSPRARRPHEVLERAVADARALARGGADGLLLENFGDAPFAPGEVEPHVPALLAVAALEARRATGLPVGVNVLRNDAQAALAAALASGADFIRVNVHVGTAFTDQGQIDGRAHETLRYRRSIGCRAAVFADVWVKHARPAGGGDLTTAAREVAYRGLADVLLVTGPETGAPPDPQQLSAVRRAVPDRPVYVASGVSPENVGRFREADGFIVGTALKRGGRTEGPVDPVRVRALARAIRGRQAASP